MTTHEMRLNEEPFNKIKQGTKTIELRLYDKKRKAIKIGDTIQFTMRTDKHQKVNTIAHDLVIASNFEKLCAKIDLGGLDCPHLSAKDIVHSMTEFYTFEMQKKYGVVAIVIAKI